ncbi:hypothetical protein F6V25_07895 [Oryzomonas japonica]|uniref:Uncharacterized protein n=1 Tax=Oryzomonas japonica TaxID=2603858 RepID=A0A7J4ZRP4_9BACT|nr:hypothetical protein [Oryzomonas japonica]KAB0665635.1 hypothetical protein F6V25_07895 [Oryzomonas japonica]
MQNDKVLNDSCMVVSAAHRKFLTDVAEEIQAARKKFPDNGHLLAALVEEVGELATAYLENEGTSRVWDEAKQVACVAARIATEGDSDFFPASPSPRARGCVQTDLNPGGGSL